MGASRREFLGRLGGLVAGAAGVPAIAGHGARRVRAAAFFEWKALRAGVHVAVGQGGNSLAVQGLLVDCKNAPFGDVLRREAVERAGPIDLVVNTHHHADHTGGNHAFIKDVPTASHEGAQPRVVLQTDRYISQIKQAVIEMDGQPAEKKALVADDWRRLHDRMADLRAGDFTPTRRLVDGEEVDLRGTRAVFRHFGPGHTDNDVAVVLPGADAIHTGDLVFAGRHPFIDAGGGGNTRGWQDSLRALRGLCSGETIVIPGHGEVGDAGLIDRQVEYFDTLRRIVAYARDNDGMARAEVVKLKTGAFEGLAGGETALARNLGAMFDELEAEAR